MPSAPTDARNVEVTPNVHLLGCTLLTCPASETMRNTCITRGLGGETITNERLVWYDSNLIDPRGRRVNSYASWSVISQQGAVFAPFFVHSSNSRNLRRNAVAFILRRRWWWIVLIPAATTRLFARISTG